MSNPEVRIHVVVSGRVQGVGYRAFARDAALKCNARGWVKNRADGNVEAVIEGTREETDCLLQEMKKGPAFGHVKNVSTSELSLNEQKPFTDFQITY